MPKGREDAGAALGLARAFQSIVSFLRGRYGLLTAFAVVHVVYALALLPVMLRGAAEGDLPLYRTWALASIGGNGPVLDGPWVYPAGALLPIVLPMLGGRAGYQAFWLLMIAVLNAAALLTLTKGLRDRKGYPAAWWFLAFEFLLGPVSMLRLEAVTVPLAIIALVLIVRRPAVAGALIAAAAWIKVWPVSLAASAFIVSRRRWPILLGGLAVSVGIAAIVVLFGGRANLFSFVAMQSDRSLQLEAPIATPWVWGSVLGLHGFRIFQDVQLATREVAGPGATEAASAVGTAMYVACAAILVLLVVARVRLRRLGDDALRFEPPAPPPRSVRADLGAHRVQQGGLAPVHALARADRRRRDRDRPGPVALVRLLARRDLDPHDPDLPGALHAADRREPVRRDRPHAPESPRRRALRRDLRAPRRGRDRSEPARIADQSSGPAPGRHSTTAFERLRRVPDFTLTTSPSAPAAKMRRPGRLRSSSASAASSSRTRCASAIA